MATPTVARAKTASGQKETSVAESVQVAGVSRREFLYYAWGASLALLTAQTGGLLLWFGLPRFREGEFGGIFSLNAGALPQLDAAPGDNPGGKFWLSNTAEGVVALYKVCTHLGCLYKWVDANHRFECPCHGSKFDLEGKYIEGPAPRSLDRFAMTIRTKAGQELVSDAEGNPIPVAAADIDQIFVNTGAKIQRAGRD